jgi:hypothetical protein
MRVPGKPEITTPSGPEQFCPAMPYMCASYFFLVAPMPAGFHHPWPSQAVALEDTVQGQFSGMFSHLTSTQLIVAACAIVVVVIAVAAYVVRRRTRTRALRDRFGSEYDRAVVSHGSSRRAEAKLAGRETRVDALEIRELGATERDRFVAEWHTVQSRFVDHPKAALTEADDLVNSLLEARGYPRASFEQRAADVSVNYPVVMDSYRQAHTIAVRPGLGEATTEELRTAMIQYRSMFDELVQSRKPNASRNAA